MTNPQCIHIPDGSVVVSGELFDMACAAIAERDKLLAEIERLSGEAEVTGEQLAQLRGFAEAHKTCRGSDEPGACAPDLRALLSKWVSYMDLSGAQPVSGDLRDNPVLALLKDSREALK
jgi:hypothetical protein